VHLRKSGVYRFDSEPARLRVVKGAVDVEAKGKTFELKDGKELALTGDMAIAKFDAKDTDALSRWSYRRAEYVAMANVSAAKSLHDSGGTYGGYANGLYNAGYGGSPCSNLRSSLWAYNPFFGMYTYIPCSGRYYSPYGFMLWSPQTVYRVYAPRPVYSPNRGGIDNGFSVASRGYSDIPQASGGYSGAVSSVSSGSAAAASPGVSAGSAPSASGGVSHSGGGGGGHR
jgi:hypothetical protein